MGPTRCCTSNNQSVNPWLTLGLDLPWHYSFCLKTRALYWAAFFPQPGGLCTHSMQRSGEQDSSLRGAYSLAGAIIPAGMFALWTAIELVALMIIIVIETLCILLSCHLLFPPVFLPPNEMETSLGLNPALCFTESHLGSGRVNFHIMEILNQCLLVKIM